MTDLRQQYVRNCRTESFDIYVGRKKSGMHYGNPFSHKAGTLAAVKVNTVEESVDAFRAWLGGTAYFDIEPERREWIWKQINDGILTGKTLGCFGCQPVCHAEPLAECANT